MKTRSLTLKELNDIRVLYLGKKGPIQEAMKSMKNMDPDQRKTFGQTSNKVKQELSKAVEDKKEVLEHQAIIDKINSETIDLSLKSRWSTVKYDSISDLVFIFPSTRK